MAEGVAGCTYLSEQLCTRRPMGQWDVRVCGHQSSDCPDNNGDGFIGVGDVLILLSAFGNTCD